MSCKQLFRSVQNRRIAGVAGGIAEYFGVDPTIIRLLWLLSIFLGGGGILAYLIAWIIIPEAPKTANGEIQTVDRAASAPEPPPQHSGPQYNKVYMYIGIFLILLGGIILLKALLPWDLTPYTWALFLISLGVVLLIPRRTGPK